MCRMIVVGAIVGVPMRCSAKLNGMICSVVHVVGSMRPHWSGTLEGEWSNGDRMTGSADAVLQFLC